MLSNMMLVQLKMTKWLGTTLVLISTFKFEQIKTGKSCLILLCWIRIRILNVDPDPDPAEQSGC
jgi:hypothetical protein